MSLHKSFAFFIAIAGTLSCMVSNKNRTDEQLGQQNDPSLPPFNLKHKYGRTAPNSQEHSSQVTSQNTNDLILDHQSANVSSDYILEGIIQGNNADETKYQYNPWFIEQISESKTVGYCIQGIESGHESTFSLASSDAKMLIEQAPN